MTTTHDKVLSFYRHVLKSVNVHENESGILCRRVISNSTPVPITVTDKSGDHPVDKWLALPTKDVLARLNEDNLMGFNPLSESTVRGESEVFQALKQHVTLRINIVIWQLVKMINYIALNKEVSEKLNSHQMQFMVQALGGEQPNDKFIGKFEKLWLSSGKSDNANLRVVTIFIKRDAKQAGVAVPYSRAAVVNFPIARELEKDQTTLLGVTFAKYEIRMINSILNALLPGITEDDRYSYFGNPVNVPNFTVLMYAWYAIAAQLNTVSTLFSDYLLDDDDLIDLGWFTDMNQLPKWNGVIPSMSGNIGEGGEVEQTSPRREQATEYTVQAIDRATPDVPKREERKEERRDTGASRRSESRYDKEDSEDLRLGLIKLIRENSRREERESRSKRRRAYGASDRFRDDDDDYDDRRRYGSRDRSSRRRPVI